MQLEPRDGKVERSVVIACITTTEFLVRILSKVDREPFRSKDSNLVYSWCVEHFVKYQTAPGAVIKQMFEQWAATNSDKDTHTRIERLLSSLSRESETVSIGYALDSAEKFFNQVKLERLQEELRIRLDRGNIDGAIKDTISFTKISLSATSSINVLEDKAAQKRALENKQKVLISFPGATGIFFGQEMSEDSFVAVMAQAKGGKSYVLLDFAWRAMRQGRQVAYFQVGDLTQDQIMGRMHRRASYRHIRAKISRFPTSIMLPEERGALAILEHENRVYEKELSWKAGERAFQKVLSKTKGSIHLFCYPIKTVSVADIKAVLTSCDQEGWTPQVIVIDYAGNLAHTDNKSGSIEQTAHTWAMMRQLSEMRKCLVITANQTNKEGFSSWVLTRKHFADSKMILAHVTAFMGISMTAEEKEAGVLRYNWVVSREEEFPETHCLYCGHYLDACNPCVVSCLPERKER